MPQIKTALLLAFLALMLLMSGCGDTNSDVVFYPESGKHPGGWASAHSANATADSQSCVECHGETFDGGISKVSCMSPSALDGFRCHASNPGATTTECISCHGVAPYGPYGNTAFNRQFAHGSHTALLVQSGLDGSAICNTCHLNGGPGSDAHARATTLHATVNIPVTFKANSTAGTFGYNPANATCSRVSCHGGKVTTPWTAPVTGITANDNAVCYRCHERGTAAGVPQYNSFYSGVSIDGSNLHNKHLDNAFMQVFCTDCHNIGTLTSNQKHFGGILTNTLTAPGQTIGNNNALSPTKIGNYDISTKRCTNITCHSFNASWNYQ